jgi:hypothetical protein
MKLDIIKKGLNRKIKEYNEKLAQLREEEKVNKTKKDALQKLEATFAKFVKGEVAESSLYKYYDSYNEIKMEVPELELDVI